MPCDLCEKKLATEQNLKVHKATCHSGTSFACETETCGKSFSTKERLGIHRELHSSAMFPCTICPKYFKSKHRVEQHEKIHKRAKSPESPKAKKGRKIKMKTCEDCGRMFRSTKFRLHKKFHEKDRSLQCKKCEKFFRSPIAVKRHVKTVHDQIREYSCKNCLFSASSEWHLRLHVSKVHHNILDTCTICLVQVKSEYHHVVGQHKKESSWKDYVENKKRINKA